MSNTEDWIYKLFVKKGLLYLRVLNKMWEKAGEEVFNIKRLLDSLGVKEGSLVLDLGCGNGRIAINLAKLGYKVYGVDISPVFIKDALEKARLYNVEDKTFFKTCDVRRIDEKFDKIRFDVVLMYLSIL
jgi:cyclopropane fatty-acyl-phospholipid synthase-like methyltransferase